MLFFVTESSISDNELATIGPLVVTTAPPTTKPPKVDTFEDSIGLSVEAILAYALGGSSFLLSMPFSLKFIAKCRTSVTNTSFIKFHSSHER